MWQELAAAKMVKLPEAAVASAAAKSRAEDTTTEATSRMELLQMALETAQADTATQREQCRRDAERCALLADPTVDLIMH